MKLFTRLFKSNNFQSKEYQIVPAFDCGGVTYFQLEKIEDMPAIRGIKTAVFYSEFEMKCTLEYLRLYVEATENILTRPNVSIFKIKELNDQLKQRLDLALDTELLYKLAAVNFFPKDENLEDFDIAFNARKVAHWKKYMKKENFFAQQPLQNLLPVLKDMDKHLESYSTAIEKLNAMHWDSIYKNLPEGKRELLKGKSYFSAAVLPEVPKVPTPERA